MSSDKQLDKFNCLLALKFHKILTKLDDIFFFFLQRHFDSDVFQGMLVVFFVFDQYLKVELILILLLSQSHSFFIVIEIFTDFATDREDAFATELLRLVGQVPDRRILKFTADFIEPLFLVVVLKGTS